MSQFPGRCLGDATHGKLGPAVHCQIGIADMTRLRRSTDDFAAVTQRLERVYCRLYAPENTTHVDVERSPIDLWRNRFDWSNWRNACVIDDHMQVTQAIHRCLHGLEYILTIGNIDLDRQGFSARFPDVFSHLIGCFKIHIGAGYGETICRQAQCNGLSDPLTGTGYKSNFSQGLTHTGVPSYS
ncbi:hypothetical protein D3C85_1114670 [compost metagenome]